MAQSKKHKNKKTKKNRPIVITSIIAVVVVIAIILIVSLGTSQKPEKTQYAAVVNDEKIEMAYLDKMYNGVDPMVRMQLTKFQFLNMSLIPDVLLYQEVQKAEVIVTDEEVQIEINKSLVSMGLTMETLSAQLMSVNSSYDEYKTFTKRRMETMKFINEKFPAPTVTDEEARTFFEDNNEAFKTNLGENVTYEVVSEGIKMGIGMESQKALVMDYVNDLRKSAKILVSNELLKS